LDLPYQLNKTEKEGKTKSNIDTSMNVVGSCGNIMVRYDTNRIQRAVLDEQHNIAFD
jgi:hypothetical protein